MLSIEQIIQLKRKEANLSQMELAKRAGVTQAMISKVESGKDVRLSTLKAIAETLNLTILAVSPEEAFQLTHALRISSKKPQSLLEQLQVSDDDE